MGLLHAADYELLCGPMLSCPRFACCHCLLLLLLQASWHPGSSSHFAVLASDNRWRLYHTTRLAETEQTFWLRLPGAQVCPCMQVAGGVFRMQMPLGRTPCVSALRAQQDPWEDLTSVNARHAAENTLTCRLHLLLTNILPCRLPLHCNQPSGLHGAQAQTAWRPLTSPAHCLRLWAPKPGLGRIHRPVPGI